MQKTYFFSFFYLLFVRSFSSAIFYLDSSSPNSIQNGSFNFPYSNFSSVLSQTISSSNQANNDIIMYLETSKLSFDLIESQFNFSSISITIMYDFAFKFFFQTSFLKLGQMRQSLVKKQLLI